MSRIIATICLLLLLFSPMSALASESSIPEISSDNLIPVFLFKDQDDGLLNIVPIEEDLFVWAYAIENKLIIGNITGDGTHTYTWDYNNRLASSINGSTTYNYSYDHEGNRVKKVNGENNR